MEFSFKFKIGDVLQHKSTAYLTAQERYRGAYVQPLIVLGRIWEECPGGVQKHYRIRGNDIGKFVQVHEEEVEPYVTHQ